MGWSKVYEVIASWFISPALSGVVAALFFVTLRTLVLRSENSFERTLKAFPIIVFFTVLICTFFIIYKGGKGLGWSKIPVGEGLGYAALVVSCFVL